MLLESGPWIEVGTIRIVLVITLVWFDTCSMLSYVLDGVWICSIPIPLKIFDTRVFRSLGGSGEGSIIGFDSSLSYYASFYIPFVFSDYFSSLIISAKLILSLI